MKAAKVSDSGAHCSRASKHSSSCAPSESEEPVLPVEERMDAKLLADLTLPVLLPTVAEEGRLGRLQRTVGVLGEGVVTSEEEGSADTVKW